MSTLNAVPFRSTIFYTAAGTPAPVGSVLMIGSNGMPGFTTNIGVSANLGSTMVSLGASTNQTYGTLSSGSYTTGWISTLTGLTSTVKVSINQNGANQIALRAGTSTINVSNNSGVSWTSLTGANGLPVGATAFPITASGTPNYTSISQSATSQYQLASVSGGLLYTSANYGTSWSPAGSYLGTPS